MGAITPRFDVIFIFYWYSHKDLFAVRKYVVCVWNYWHLENFMF